MGVWVGSARRWLASGMGVCFGARSAPLPYQAPHVTESPKCSTAMFALVLSAPLGFVVAPGGRSCPAAVSERAVASVQHKQVLPVMAAGPEVQAAFAAVMLLSVSHGLLPQPKPRSDVTTGSAAKRRRRAGQPRLCAEAETETEPVAAEPVVTSLRGFG